MSILMFSVLIFGVIGWIGFDSSKSPYESLNHDDQFCSTADHGDGTGEDGSCNDYFLSFSSSIYQVWILLVKVRSRAQQSHNFVESRRWWYDYFVSPRLLTS